MSLRCETCRFWDTSTTDTQDPSLAACRVSPPIQPINSHRGSWPMTDQDDWCGSHVAVEPRAPNANPKKCPTCGIADWNDCDCVPF